VKILFTKVNRLFLGLVVILLVSSLSACIKADGGSSSNGDGSGGSGSPEGPFLQIVNASQPSLPQDLYFNGAKTAFTLGFGQTTGFQSVATGTSNIALYAAGTQNVTANTGITIIGGFNTLYYTDDNSFVATGEDRTLPQSGNARISFAQLSSQLALNNVDIYITGGNKIISSMADKTVSIYYEVPATTTSFTMTNTGSTTALLNMPVTLTAGKLYTIFIAGAPSKPLNYLLLTQN